MELIDFNGQGNWSRKAILDRYARYAAEAGIAARDLSVREHSEGDRHWVYPVMDHVIDGIKAMDIACIRIGVEFVEENEKFPFGKILKANTARALRQSASLLTEEQKERIRNRVFGLMAAGHIPHEFHEYSRLVRKIGFQFCDVPKPIKANRYTVRFRRYFELAYEADRA